MASAVLRGLSGLSLKYYEPVKPLGAGAYGDVWEVRHTSTGTSFAAKLMRRNAWSYQGSAEKELTMLYAVKRHPKIVPWYEMLLTGYNKGYSGGHEFQMFTMELCDGDLAKYIKDLLRS